MLIVEELLHFLSDRAAKTLGAVHKLREALKVGRGSTHILRSHTKSMVRLGYSSYKGEGGGQKAANFVLRNLLMTPYIHHIIVLYKIYSNCGHKIPLKQERLSYHVFGEMEKYILGSMLKHKCGQ